jgi:hypothetical protein
MKTITGSHLYDREKTFRRPPMVFKHILPDFSCIQELRRKLKKMTTDNKGNL